MALAAKKLSLTQPAVSQAIADLETRMGVKLFDRSVRPLALTPAGEIMRQRASALVSEARQLATVISHTARGRLALIRAGLVESAHDCSEGGLAVALAECTFDSGGIGVAVDLESIGTAPWQVNATLFGESASRIVVSVTASKLDAVLAAADEAGVPAKAIGKTGGTRITLSVDGTAVVDSAVADAEQAWAAAIATRMGRR